MTRHLVQIIDSLKIGGAQKLLLMLADQAQAHSIELTAVSLSSTDHRLILDGLTARGVQVVAFPARKLFDPTRIIRLTRFLAGGGFDLVQCHLSYANILGALCARLAGLPVIATLHSTSLVSLHDRPAIDRLETAVISHCANNIIAVCHSVAEAYQARLRNRHGIEIIPNAVPVPEKITPEERLRLRQEIAGDASRFIVISVGSFIPIKGYGDLLLSFSSLRLTHPDIILALVGDGPLFEEIRSQVSRLSLDKNVILLGERGDVPHLLAASDLYVSSSLQEGLPLTILEAMMAGLPVVATRVGDVSRLLTPDIGIVVPPHQPDGLSAAVDKIMNDAVCRQRMGKAAKAIAMKNYSAQGWMEKMLGVYQRVGEVEP